MRLIAERLMSKESTGATFVDKELVSMKLKPLQPPKAKFHIY
jgi:hypothetical protein